MDYEIAEINELERFLDLEDEWNDLLSRSHCDIPFLRHEWIRNWWEHFGNGGFPVFIIGRKSARLVFAIPLMEKVRYLLGFPYRVLASQTNHHSFRYHFLLQIGEETVIRAFWDYLRHRSRKWHLLLLKDLPSDVTAHHVLMNHARGDGYPAEVSVLSYSPFIPIQGTWDDYFDSLKQKFRSNMRNRLKRLNASGKVSYEHIRDEKGACSALENGFQIEQKSWKGKQGTAIACDPKLVSFYSRWAMVAARKGWLRLSFLKVDGTPAAFDYSLSYHGRLYCMKIGYDPDYHQFSVGQILCGEILKGCFQDGFRGYDFLGSTSSQKEDWTTLSRKIEWLYIYNHGPVSRLHFLCKHRVIRHGKEFLSMLHKATPRPMRKR